MSVITTNMQTAIDDLKKGKPVAIPTETVYGLAAAVDKTEGIRAVFSMKDRPLTHPLIVHVANNQDLSKWVEFIPDYAHKLMNAFWPGPLTLVFRAKKGQFSDLVTGGQSTVAIRSPGHPVAQALLSQLNVPVVAPSANPFGKISPTTAEHVKQSFPHSSLTILDGGRCKIGIESTIIDATHADRYKILRHGLIHQQDLAAIAPQLTLSAESSIRTPGAMASHYQPDKVLYYFVTSEEMVRCYKELGQQPFLISFEESDFVNKKYQCILPKDAKYAAFELYYRLREADASDASYIMIMLPPQSDEWAALIERISKAGQPYTSKKG